MPPDDLGDQKRSFAREIRHRHWDRFEVGQPIEANVLLEHVENEGNWLEGQNPALRIRLGGEKGEQSGIGSHVDDPSGLLYQRQENPDRFAFISFQAASCSSIAMRSFPAGP
jgi:hypothetical protein